MNPRQRRGVLLMVLATLGAVVVFVSVFGYVASVQEQVGDRVSTLRLVRDVPAFEPVDESMLERVDVPVRWLPETVVTDERSLQGLVAGTHLRAGSYVQDGMFVDRPALQQGQREIAILIDAETGVAGKVGRGSVVDIYATFQGESPTPARSEIIVTNARVIDVGNLTQEEGGDFDSKQVVPVTFALSVEESLALTYAESFASSVRLALVGGGDRTPLAPEERVFNGGLAGPGVPAGSGTTAAQR